MLELLELLGRETLLLGLELLLLPKLRLGVAEWLPTLRSGLELLLPTLLLGRELLLPTLLGLPELLGLLGLSICLSLPNSRWPST